MKTKIISVLILLGALFFLASCKEKSSYVISFNADGGTRIEDVTHKEGESFNMPVDPTKEGYDFSGWYFDNQTFTKPFTVESSIKSNTTVYAQWTLKQFMINFDSNGGTAVESKTHAYQTKIDRPLDPIKEGHAFEGWYTNLEDDSTAWLFSINEVTSNITLYAKWLIDEKPVLLTVTIEPNNEADRTEVSYEIGELIFEPANIINGDKILLGWYTTYNYEGKAWDFEVDEILGDMVLYAKWATRHIDTGAYTGDATVEMRDDANNAAALGLDPAIFYVKSVKNVSNNVGLNKAGYMRIYRPSPQNGKENILTISVHESFVITGVYIAFGSEKGDAKLTLGNQIIMLSNYGTSKTYSDLNVVSFSITNTMPAGGDRTDIKSIEITYLQIGEDPITDDDINRPIINVKNEDRLIELLVGQPFIAPTLTAVDVEDGEVVVDIVESSLPDVSKVGIYYVWFSSVDSEDNQSKTYITVIVRTVDVADSPYYEGYETFTGEALKVFLNMILNDSLTLQTYATARQALEIADRDPNNHKNVLLMYDRDSDKGSWDHPIWEREHVWPNSKLGIDRVTNEQANIGSDLHNLRAIRPHVNQTRSNYMFVEKLNPEDGFGIVSGETYYPGDADRGDVARILFYMNTVWNLVIREDIGMLIEWHLGDPVDDFEKIRNEVIFGYQGNRNPYIDHPEFVEKIYGLVKLSDGQTAIFEIVIPVTDLDFIRSRNTFFM